MLEELQNVHCITTTCWSLWKAMKWNWYLHENGVYKTVIFKQMSREFGVQKTYFWVTKTILLCHKLDSRAQWFQNHGATAHWATFLGHLISRHIKVPYSCILQFLHCQIPTCWDFYKQTFPGTCLLHGLTLFKECLKTSNNNLKFICNVMAQTLRKAFVKLPSKLSR